MIDPNQIDLATLYPKPLIDEADYGWTGVIGEHPCLLIGDQDLENEDTDGTPVLDTRKWKNYGFSARQERRSQKFHAVAPQAGEHVLIHVYSDLANPFTSTGAHLAKRSKKKFTGLFRITERGEDWIRAELVERD